MYEGFFGLAAAPFAAKPDTDFYCALPDHERALSAHEDAIRNSCGVFVLTGPPGVGKSMVAQALLRRLGCEFRAISIADPPRDPQHLWARLHGGLGPSGENSAPSDSSPEAVKSLLESAGDAQPVLLVMDGAHRLGSQIFECLAALSAPPRPSCLRLPILLVGRLQLLNLIAHPESGFPRRRLCGIQQIGPLSLEQTSAYIAHRLSKAGGSGKGPFTSDAIRSIHELSGGLPRRINRLCDRALRAAFLDSKRQVDESMVASFGPEQHRRSGAGRRSALEQALPATASTHAPATDSDPRLRGEEAHTTSGADATVAGDARERILRRLKAHGQPTKIGSRERIEQIAREAASVKPPEVPGQAGQSEPSHRDQRVELPSLSQRIEEQRKSLAELTDRAAQAEKTLAAAHGRVELISRRLPEHVSQLLDAARLAKAERERAEALTGSGALTRPIERLERGKARIAQVAAAAIRTVRKRCGQVARRAREQARALSATVDETLRETLSRVEERVRLCEQRWLQLSRRADELQESLDAGTQALEARMTQLAARERQMETLSARIDEQLAQWTRHAEAVPKYQAAFEQAAQAVANLEEDLRQARVKSDAVAARLESYLAEPRRVTQEAREEIERLESVYKVVQKVFARLSQTSLEAADRIRQFEQLRGEADQRLVTLDAETKRSAGALREWVGEAVRVQERLSAMLAEQPPLHQTHGPAALERLGKLATEIPELGPVGGRTAPKRSNSPHTRPVRLENRLNPEEVASLIQDSEKDRTSLP